MKNTEKKYPAEIIFFARVLWWCISHNFDNVLKDSVQFSRYFINFALSHAAQQTIASLEHVPILLLFFDHRLMKVLLIISGGKYVPRVFVWSPDQWRQ